MKKFVLVLVVFLMVSTAVQANPQLSRGHMASHVARTSAAPIYRAPINTKGFTTSFPQNGTPHTVTSGSNQRGTTSSNRGKQSSSRGHMASHVARIPVVRAPINQNGFTHYPYAGQNVQTNVTVSKTSSSVAATTTQSISRCNGLTLYDRNGNAISCN